VVSSNTTQVTTKRTSGQSSIFVKAFQLLVSYPGRQKYIKVSDFENGVKIRSSVMLQAYGKCNAENNKLPRQITNDDKDVKFNQGKRGLVGYVQRLNILPCSALISAYQDNIKQFCESKSVERDNDAVFRGKPAIIFWKENKETKYITFVIFDPNTKRYVSSYKMKSDSPKASTYKRNRVLGVIESKL
jgi:hypothetical protein